MGAVLCPSERDSVPLLEHPKPNDLLGEISSKVCFL